MSKLDPKPTTKDDLYSWDFLNTVLQTNFKNPGKDTVIINLNQFEMTKEEIITQAEQQGYTVTDKNDGYLHFK